ncbi:MAG: glycyl-tRNA synthetase beta chain, partial [Pseudomonadota bacterium]|nr:glycyl-tRNA synthetase beta chain [Pseudomonadota bacterium]
LFRSQQADREVEKRGPAIQAAFDKEGKFTKAAEGFARSCNVSVEQLGRIKTDKGEWLGFVEKETGKAISEIVPKIVEQALAKLPIPKRMRWADRKEEFVRPVHWVVMLSGNDVIDAPILGIQAGRETRGHRFHHPQPIILKSPQDYAESLRKGFVIADMEERKTDIRQQVEQAAEKLGGRAVIEDDLLQEVAALVEWPVAVMGDFEQHFLQVPKEALISTMQGNQKYFPLLDGEGNLMPHFITISNISSTDVSKVKAGNERVIRPRLSDAAFFWNQDRKEPLEKRLGMLDKVVFQNKLGTLGDKSRRVAKIAERIADSLGANKSHAHRAALLCKCDLMTSMVYEFPELQGIMGRYYATHDGEPADVAVALDEQYMPRFAGDQLPGNIIGQILALADKLDTLLGIFAIGQKPSGEKDPFALRRAALGVLRILIERGLTLDLRELLGYAADALADVVNAKPAVDETLEFMLERLRVYYTNQNIAVDVYEAVAELKPTNPVDFDRRMNAVDRFRKLPEAESLAAANKRISNILKKVEGNIPQQVDARLLQEAAEKKLHADVEALAARTSPLFDQGDYQAALQHLAGLRNSVDEFFDKVMVMADDTALKNNRLALLSNLRSLFLRAADLSKLQS